MGFGAPLGQKPRNLWALGGSWATNPRNLRELGGRLGKNTVKHEEKSKMGSEGGLRRLIKHVRNDSFCDFYVFLRVLGDLVGQGSSRERGVRGDRVNPIPSRVLRLRPKGRRILMILGSILEVILETNR